MDLRPFLTVALWIVCAATAGCSTLRPTPANDLLAGTKWTLQQLGDRGAIEAAAPTIAFGRGGEVSGSGSCNRFNGAVTVSGKSIAFGPLTTTSLSCAEALQVQERAYFEALKDAQWFLIEIPTLKLYTKALDRPLTFVITNPG